MINFASTFRVAIVVVMIFATTPVSALTCTEIRQFLQGVAIARDQGATASRMKSILADDSNFTSNEKAVLMRYIDKAYTESDAAAGAFVSINQKDCKGG